ncbi:MAG: hypothetical protein ACD_28C00147G0004 [uncultured bacterium]|nr:MAG: hypothetical protein ACD_28C00147G0004 [uncultured bacterium]KKT75195.1 MAG: dTDP-D-glucose 4,6-dehydratase [Candidatus Peregrinibacteria bacterium GW2011_GWA2_44_7]
MKTYLITGGAGFIGVNTADFFLKRGEKVIIFDNLSRQGTSENLKWIQERYPDQLEFIPGDIRSDLDDLNAAVKKSDYILHLAAQVAVTTSVTNPREDFEINALGTFNVLEAMRLANPDAVLLYASTNKVYGGMEDIKTHEMNGRYEYIDMPYGISETRLLDFHSPYGCSKGAADQYVRDYHRIYGLKTIVFRQSCIYGIRQFGVEDQGWVAWFTIASLLNQPITIYGDGKQVRDVLFIEDLINAYDSAFQQINRTCGQIYNVGGGSEHQMSLRELLAFLESFLGKKIPHTFSDWRPGDQPVFVCDIRKAELNFGWKPQISVEQGVEKLYGWVKDNMHLFSHLLRQEKGNVQSEMSKTAETVSVE